ncbi:MAG TPA: amidophosphoribosyltransferase [Candidatus Borkfalkia faecipullorum]|uniref:Amidophosphoribosyltransferase n=1 Tax=Candidatus Borkfalkia faecipullorum TaxID=2838510 RepID=A0A9D2AFP7_9FIRM|nr:amidophosphoribosyltransferase [Candidatus Borkfalkia faecipullorum]
MSGFFGVVSKKDCVFDLFFGTDYHSHLGTRRGGMAVYGANGFNRAIHNIENSPFRTKFERDFDEMKGNIGIGCISDSEPQPLLVRSHLGNFAIATVGRINNIDALVQKAFQEGTTHFLEMSGGSINATELVASLVNRGANITEGIKIAQDAIDGSMSILILTSKGIFAARDKFGKTPVVIGKKADAFCVSFESFAYLNLGYEPLKELGPGEIDFIAAEGVDVLCPPRGETNICTFLWVYYGNPASIYEGQNVENMRYGCGSMLAKRDNITADAVAGLPDSGTAHAIGYANASKLPLTRPFVKYTHTWPRSFMPQNQSRRDLIAHMKLIPLDMMIRNKRLVLIDDSLVRGTQLRGTADFLYRSGAKELHIRLACPPLLYGCPYLNFSRSSSELELIARRKVAALEGEGYESKLQAYTDPDSPEYAAMIEAIRSELQFTSLRYNRLDDMLAATGVPACKCCTYCWNGKK